MTLQCQQTFKQILICSLVTNIVLFPLKSKRKVKNRKFNELYDFAQSGYITLSREGKITELNLTMAKMPGVERSLLIYSRFGLFNKVLSEFFL
jgi:hypothetical protein